MEENILVTNDRYLFFCSSFEERFHKCKNKRIAIYGTGNNARIILDNIKNYSFTCVIADSTENNTFCGIRICNIKEAVLIADVIIIAAAPTSTATIYKRICNDIPSNIDVYDMRGHLMNNKLNAEYYLNTISVSDVERKYSKYLLSKFSFNSSGNLYIDSYKTIAYIIAPITINYMQYILSYAKDYDFILFASRDGYFLQRLYSEYIEKKQGKWAKGVYLYTSRQALENAYKCSDDKYEKYITSLGLNGKCAVVDIVTQGSVCNGIFKLIGYMPDLIALGTTSIPNKYIQDEKMVHSMLGNVNEEIDRIPYSFSDFSELHLFLEILYASKDGQFLNFTEDLIPIFNEESKYNDILISNVQKELQASIDEIIEQGYKEFSNNYVMQILNLFYNKYSSYDETIKKMFIFDDPYDERLSKCNLIDKLGW